MKVLFVDDEPRVLEAIQRMLFDAAGNWQVETAVSGSEALEKLAKAPFDVIVTDMRMPGMDGAALWREVKARDPALAARMLFVTGDTLSPGAERFLAESRCASLDKPFARDDLVGRVHELLLR